MKKLVAVFMSMALAAAACACSAPAAEAPAAAAAAPAEVAPTAEAPAAEAPAAEAAPAPTEVITLTYAEVNNETSLMGQTAQRFKEKVEELSEGSIKVEIYASGVFGSEGDVLDTMTSGGGTVDISRISTASLKDYDGINVTNLLSVPYIFSNRAHFWNTVNSDIGEEIKNECHDAGLNIRGLFFVEEGFRNFFFTKEVKSIEDLKGKKIRVSTDSTMTGTVEGLGGSPTTIAFTELYSALSSGIVDGAEQPIVNYQSNSFNEVAPYMILDGHTFGSGMVIITDEAWDKLSPEQQKVLVVAGEAAGKFNGEQSETIENNCKADLVSQGVTFVEVPDLQPWRDACAGVISNVTAGLESYVEKIQALN